LRPTQTDEPGTPAAGIANKGFWDRLLHQAQADQTAVSENKTERRASPGKLEEIIVTARRREENIQTVPIAITAVSQEALRDQNIKDYADLQYVVPSLTMMNGIYAGIRGLSGWSTDGQAVISYLNEVALPN